MYILIIIIIYTGKYKSYNSHLIVRSTSFEFVEYFFLGRFISNKTVLLANGIQIIRHNIRFSAVRD